MTVEPRTTDEPSTVDDRIRSAQQRIDPRQVVAVLRDLVRIPSVYNPDNPRGNEAAAADYVARVLDGWGLAHTRREVAPGRPNVVVDLPGIRPGPILIFEGHTDVVTAGDPATWSVDPFAAQVRDGRLYGRGACDMKGGLTAMLCAAGALHQSGRDFAGTLRLAILADEEGLMRGAKGFVADGYLDGAMAAIICEPEGDRVCIAQKGAIRQRARFVGRMAHGAMPQEGVNPVAALGAAIVACRRLEAEIQDEQEPHPLLGQFHLTPTVALGGEREQGNVIPAVAELVLDIRTTPAQDHAVLRGRVAAAVNGAAADVDGVTVQIETLDDRPATETDPHEPIVRAALTAHEAECGIAPPLGGVPGSTDGTIFWAATRIPLVTWGPGAARLPHQADEYVDLDEVVRYARMYAGAALRYFDLMEAEAR
jgi:succinyl-diaminopimelate desuccinylase